MDCSSKFRVCITNHMLYNEVDEQNILVRKVHTVRITYYEDGKAHTMHVTALYLALDVLLTAIQMIRLTKLTGYMAAFPSSVA